MSCRPNPNSCLFLLQAMDDFYIFILFFKDFTYLLMKDTNREAETQAEGEAGSLRGVWCGARSRDSGIMPWAEGRRSTAKPPRCPSFYIFKWLRKRKIVFCKKWKIVCNSNFGVHKYSFIGTQTCLFICMLFLAAFMLQRQSGAVATETVCPPKPKIFIIWPSPEKVCWPLG